MQQKQKKKSQVQDMQLQSFPNKLAERFLASTEGVTVQKAQRQVNSLTNTPMTVIPWECLLAVHPTPNPINPTDGPHY